MTNWNQFKWGTICTLERKMEMKEPKNIITVADLLRLVMDNKLSLETVIVADEEDHTARLFQTAVVNRGEEDSQPIIELC